MIRRPPRSTLFPYRRSSDLPDNGATTPRCCRCGGRCPESVRLGTVHDAGTDRSEEHTSELQSRSDLVCRLLLEKKKQPSSSTRPHYIYTQHCYIPARTADLL